MGNVQSSNCMYCEDTADISAHLLKGSQSSEVTTRLMNFLTSYFPGTTPADVLRLNFDVTESVEMPTVWLVSACLAYVWEQRMLGKFARLDTCRAELFAKVMLLRDTKWRHYTIRNNAAVLQDILQIFCVISICISFYLNFWLRYDDAQSFLWQLFYRG